MHANEGSVTVKCIPAFKDSRGKCQVYLRCHFDYVPNQDEAFPKGETGLPFQKGDVVEVVDQSDPDWWQALHLGDSSKSGLIPSLKFEQTRKAANLIPRSKQNKVLNKFQKKGKKKIMYQTCKNSIFDCFDVRLYEEVVKMPTVESNVIIVVGAQGLGRRAIINRLLENYPDRYATVIPDTSRQPADGELQKNGYNFLYKDDMYQDILAGRYFEWGEDKNNLYGSKLSSIRDIINSGKIALVDCDPSALKFLRTAEFMPFIVFLAAPTIDVLTKTNQTSDSKQKTKEELDQIIQESADIKETYHHYFDLTVTATGVEESYNALRENIEKRSSESHQWVPISWVY